MDPFVIENLSRMPLWLRLNSGALVYLAPLARVEPIDGHELSLNPELERLLQQQRVRCNPVALRADRAAATGAGKGTARRPAHRPAKRGAARRPARNRALVAR